MSMRGDNSARRPSPSTGTSLEVGGSDGCDTRREVILAEAVVAPDVSAGCKLAGGSWRSAYDDQEEALTA